MLSVIDIFGAKTDVGNVVFLFLKLVKCLVAAVNHCLVGGLVGLFNFFDNC